MSKVWDFFYYYYQTAIYTFQQLFWIAVRIGMFSTKLSTLPGTFHVYIYWDHVIFQLYTVQFNSIQPTMQPKKETACTRTKTHDILSIKSISVPGCTSTKCRKVQGRSILIQHIVCTWAKLLSLQNTNNYFLSTVRIKCLLKIIINISASYICYCKITKIHFIRLIIVKHNWMANNNIKKKYIMNK